MSLANFNIHILSRPSFDIDVFLNFLKDEKLEWDRSPSTDADGLIEASGRVCYMSFGKGRQSGKNNSEYIKHLISQGHESVLEHINWTFLIQGISRAFTHQLVRHRVGFSFSQLSQQYHDEHNAKFVVPPNLAEDKELFNLWEEHVESSLELYKKLAAKLPNTPNVNSDNRRELIRDLRTASRSVLPNATETKIVVTANARALRHFFALRGAIEGDWEMRKVACALYHEVTKDAPACFQDFEIKMMSDGSHKLLQTK
jgi:thymidylate synthase (FAD)|tara:strand:- start:7268 stop:8038 length:771 start_codon:yes stop_codon:yes gene_type:complete